ncbi:MAG TPA: hypothetical protein VFW25_09380 [Silvibacterium sp.]|nr:hypothetical protein [Silvibacterium sp.]
MKNSLVMVCFVLLSSLVLGQTPSESASSKLPLSTDQIAIYRAFLSDYNTGLDAPINLSDVTEEFKPDRQDLQGCLKGFAPPSTPALLHHFSNEFSDLRNIRLIDAAHHKISDPGDAIRKGDSVEHAVKAGFEAGVLRISEISFDPTHHLAALTYSFHCGSLCGNGATVVYELRDGKWARSQKSCTFWQS